jgi:hypothetical protein
MNQSKVLTPEDGAIFCFDIEDLGTDGFRASCGAVADDGDDCREEMPQFETFETRGEAQKWIAQIGARRGFREFHRRVRAP